MKKTIILLISLCLMFLGNVNAEPLQTEGIFMNFYPFKFEFETKESFQLIIYPFEEISSFEAEIVYNEDVLEKKDETISDNWDGTIKENKIKAETKTRDLNMIVLFEFEIKDLSQSTVETIKLKNIVVDDKQMEDTEIGFTVFLDHSNNNLSKLEVKGFELIPEFHPDIKEYEVIVPEEQKTVELINEKQNLFSDYIIGFEGNQLIFLSKENTIAEIKLNNPLEKEEEIYTINIIKREEKVDTKANFTPYIVILSLLIISIIITLLVYRRREKTSKQ